MNNKSSIRLLSIEKFYSIKLMSKDEEVEKMYNHSVNLFNNNETLGFFTLVTTVVILTK